MNAHEEAVKVVAKIFGHSVEEIEKIIAEQEKRYTETVRLLSMNEVKSAVATALIEVLGSRAIMYGPFIVEKICRELFDKQEGE